MSEYRNYDDEWLPRSDNYCKHVSAMTGEKLHSKADIAAELAYRDDLIEQQQARINDLEQLLRDSAKAADQFYQQRNHAIEKRDELAAVVERLRDALEPFAVGGITDCISREDYSVMRERVKDWMGVKDFKKAREAFEATPHISLNALKRDVENNLLDMLIRHFSEDEETWTSKELQSELMEIQRLRNML